MVGLGERGEGLKEKKSMCLSKHPNINKIFKDWNYLKLFILLILSIKKWMNNLIGRDKRGYELPGEVNSKLELNVLSRLFSLEVFLVKSMLPGSPRVMH